MNGKGNSHAHGASNHQGNSFANGAGAGSIKDWQLAMLMASQPNQFRDTQ